MAYLEELIDSYGLNDSEMKDYKKICDGQKAELKKLLQDNLVDGKASAEGSTYKVSLSVSTREDIDEEKLVELLKSRDYHHLIRTVEVVDAEALERDMYAELIDGETLAEMAKLRTVKEVETLKVSLNKHRKDDVE